MREERHFSPDLLSKACKVHDQAVLVKILCRDRNLHPPVMTMQRLRPVGKLPQLMGGRELFFDDEFVHLRVTYPNGQAHVKMEILHNLLTIQYLLTILAPVGRLGSLALLSLLIQCSMPAISLWAAQRDRQVTVILDPGHGGHDPGAVGVTGLAEKDVVLDIAQRTKMILTRRAGTTTWLTRSGDVFIPLETRARLAKSRQADLFVSIHANANPRRRTKGIEVFLLGRTTNRRILATAARENGTTEAEANALQRILADLARDYTVTASLELAHLTRDTLKKTLRREYRDITDLGVRRAPFYVLLHSGVPSVLVEVAHVSNVLEEQRLRTPQYRQWLAEALSEAIQRFLAARPPTS